LIPIALAFLVLVFGKIVDAYPTISDAYSATDESGGSNDGLAVLGGIAIILALVLGSKNTRLTIFRLSALVWLPLLGSALAQQVFGSGGLVGSIGGLVGIALWIPFMTLTDKWSD
jgi:hypothetical protein